VAVELAMLPQLARCPPPTSRIGRMPHHNGSNVRVDGHAALMSFFFSIRAFAKPADPASSSASLPKYHPVSLLHVFSFTVLFPRNTLYLRRCTELVQSSLRDMIGRQQCLV